MAHSRTDAGEMLGFGVEVGFLFLSPVSKRIPLSLAVPADGRVHAATPLAECSSPIKFHVRLNPSICGNLRQTQ